MIIPVAPSMLQARDGFAAVQLMSMVKHVCWQLDTLPCTAVIAEVDGVATCA